MPSDNGVETLQRVMFNAIFAADWRAVRSVT